MRRAKIIATLGPASSSLEVICQLIDAGLNVARINMSHGTHEQHSTLISTIRQASKKMSKEVGILMDLQGPKIRVDKLKKDLTLKNDEIWVIGQSNLIDNYSQYKDRFIPTVYDKLVEDCHDGARILFDDGLIIAEAQERDGDVYKIKILVGGTLKSNKGINLPDCEVSAPSFTTKDEDDLMFGLNQGVDFIALSFVRKKEDVLEVKYLLHKLKMNIPIISKIEKPQAVANLEEILQVTDLIMVARGDMGVEVGNHLVPSIQKKIIALCNQNHTPVITATQMLESMTKNPTPTRAEASDVANAIWDGSDAVMLSGETANGQYPVETLTMMCKIIEEAEKNPSERPFLRNMDLSSVNASVMVAASMIAEKIKAKKILSITQSGSSCKKISLFRPLSQVLGVTNSLATVRRLSIYWGVEPYYIENYNDKEFDFRKDVVDRIKRDFKMINGDKVVITRGDGEFCGHSAYSNSIKIEIVHDKPRVPGQSGSFDQESDGVKTITLDTSVCGSCQNCVAICPHEIWKVRDDETRNTYIDKKRVPSCAMDMECVRVCPTGAIEIIPKFD